jgi:hypothetical protein
MIAMILLVRFADLSRHRVLIGRLLKAEEAVVATITSERIEKDQAQDLIEWMTMGTSDFTLAYTFWAFRHDVFAPGRRKE